MTIRIRPYGEADVAAVCAFNRRLDAARVAFPYRLPESSVSLRLPRLDGRRICQDHFLAVEDDVVRGGYSLNWQEVSLRGEMVQLASCVEPISEGTIDRTYMLVGFQLLQDALRRSPLLYGLGIGGFHKPIARTFVALGWTLKSVPFYFKVEHAYRFLRNMKRLRRRRLAAVLMDAAAVSGTGWAGTRLASAVLRARRRRRSDVSVEAVAEFGDWADDLWKATKDEFTMIAVRDSDVLNVLYPPYGETTIRIKVTRADRLLGWAVVSDRQRTKHQYWGNMRVGTIMDCLALPGHAGHVIDAATGVLQERGVDVIVSNQSHTAWCAAFRGAGFLRGPSDCIFTASRALSERLTALDPEWTEIHVPRDGRPR